MDSQPAKDVPQGYRLLCSTRLVVAVLVMMCTLIQYSQRIDLSVNIICMVNHTALGILSRSNSTQKSSLDGPFIWSKSTQGLLLSVYFWGYLLSQLPGGILSSKYGAKWVMATAIAINSLCIFLYQSAAHVHLALIIALRFLVGLSSGFIFPSVSQIWTKWSPPNDRSLLMGLSVSGAHLGNVITLPLGGYLCTSGFAGGWPCLFYIIGVVSILWVVAWTIYYSNTPNTHRFITTREKMYISSTLPTTVFNQAPQIRKIPWRAIFTSVPIWSQFITHTAINWGFYTLLTCTPTYMKEVLRFNIKSNGALSALPYIMVWIVTMLSSFLADKIIASRRASRTAVRKAANLIGSIIPAAFLIGLGFVSGSQPYIAVILLTLAMAAFGVAFGAGFLCVCNDISQKYASIIFGTSNTIATLPGIISPFVTSAITRNQTVKEWRVVFFLAATIWMLGSVQFTIFGSSDPIVLDHASREILEATKLAVLGSPEWRVSGRKRSCTDAVNQASV